ncbi:Antibiotic biosynthesis monooxygenase [Roseibium album]|nr:Antibiotic biosynthesis monooxygenase [Roseibium album]
MFTSLTREAIKLPAIAVLLGLLAAPTLADDNQPANPVTLINSFEVDQNQLEETIRFWEQVRDFLASQPGYISTNLHQSLSPEAKFQLVNVAKWANPQAFQEAIKNMRESGLGTDMRGTVFHAALYQVIRTDKGD